MGSLRSRTAGNWVAMPCVYWYPTPSLAHTSVPVHPKSSPVKSRRTERRRESALSLHSCLSSWGLSADRPEGSTAHVLLDDPFSRPLQASDEVLLCPDDLLLHTLRGFLHHPPIASILLPCLNHLLGRYWSPYPLAPPVLRRILQTFRAGGHGSGMTPRPSCRNAICTWRKKPILTWQSLPYHR